ncbi:NlpC/P60 family protein [Saccharothrix sp. NPDC042600]|uniref:C40 family peptidase n=1 Tax=Saccharothrix TaxID=2071 RepID=UPI0033FEDDCB|nr:C40 family peptidase [Saccharothrix mutabilis subsp. capreolus]
MRSALVGLSVYLVAAAPALLVGTTMAATLTGSTAAQCAPSQTAGYGPGGSAQQIGDETYTAEQLANARTIVTVAIERRLPKRAAVLALATAMVESNLRNVDYGDRDSLGLFQQRPSQGWGTPGQILNPVYAANAFYDRLTQLPGWSSMPSGVAEQAVQRSAFPERYGPREPAAAALVERYWQGPDNLLPPQDVNARQAGVAGCPDKGRSDLVGLDPRTLPESFALPTDPRLNAAVTYGLAQVGKPYVWGAEGPGSFDCSGLMQAAWAHAGVGISRTTYSQVHDGVAVGSLSRLRPGDLVFIPGADGTAANPGHVGMYIGHGYMVDAHDEQHGVILTTLETWAPRVVAIRRIAVGGADQPPTGGDL